ncbi:MAG: acyl dehydratase [Chitinophagia bacterium]|nr:acyl dehydratase [Chitinophagia bacterium]
MKSYVYEDLEIGHQFPILDKGRISTSHIMRWSAAVENWHRIHYDYRFATEHDKLPDVLINGSWKQHILIQLAKDSLGPTSWLWKMKFKYKKMDVAGDSLHGIATILDKQQTSEFGFITLGLQLVNQNKETSTEGWSISAIPFKGGVLVAYPFVDKQEYSLLRTPISE